MAFQSHPPLASYVAGSILHQPVVTAPPVTLKQLPASPFPDVGMLQTHPLLSTSTRRADEGEEKVRNNLLARFYLIYFAKKLASVSRVIAGEAIPHLCLV
jgi:hypothetical protein